MGHSLENRSKDLYTTLVVGASLRGVVSRGLISGLAEAWNLKDHTVAIGTGWNSHIHVGCNLNLEKPVD